MQRHDFQTSAHIGEEVRFAYTGREGFMLATIKGSYWPQRIDMKTLDILYKSPVPGIAMLNGTKV